MSRIVVCPLAHVDATLATTGATRVISLLALRHRLPVLDGVQAEGRLHLQMSDIVVETEDHVLPDTAHVDLLLAFVRAWDRVAPLLIHCYAGVSRSTAAAFITLCALVPDVAEAEHARVLRAASPTATPNPRLVALADTALGRNGRMTAAIAAIGRGSDCFEGIVFSLDVAAARSRGAWLPEMG